MTRDEAVEAIAQTLDDEYGCYLSNAEAAELVVDSLLRAAGHSYGVTSMPVGLGDPIAVATVDAAEAIAVADDCTANWASEPPTWHAVQRKAVTITGSWQEVAS